MTTDATRFDVERGRIEHNGIVLCRVANRPLIPDVLWTDGRLDFEAGLEPVSEDRSAVPDELRELLLTHGYWY